MNYSITITIKKWTLLSLKKITVLRELLLHFIIIINVKLNSCKSLNMPSFCDHRYRNLFEVLKRLSCLTTYIMCHKVHVSFRKSWGTNYLGPFKGPGPPQHGRNNLVEFMLIQFPNLVDRRLLVQKLRNGSHSFGHPVYTDN